MTKILRSVFIFCAIVTLRAERVTIASWNVENYNLSSRMTRDGWRKNAPKPESEKHKLRAAIRATNPDLLALQEIGGPAFVEELRHDLAAEGLAYPYAVCLEGPDPHRRLAFLSKRPFAAVRKETRIPTGFAVPSPHEDVALVNRGLLGVVVKVAGRDVSVFTVHLKSRLTRVARDPRSEGERRAEAAAIRSKLGGAKGLALLCGDFNDGPNAASVALFGKDFFLRLDPADSAGETWTYRNDKKGFLNRSDYLFVSPELKPHVVRAFVPEATLVRGASDHRPVAAVLDFP